MKHRLILFGSAIVCALALTASAPADGCAAGYKPTCGNGGWECVYISHYSGPNGEHWLCYDPATGGWTWRW